jgi:hypothetical protein
MPNRQGYHFGIALVSKRDWGEDYMSIGIQRLLETQSLTVDYSGKGLSPEYMIVLNHMWNGRHDIAAEHAAMFLAEDDEHPATLRLYRAWIESLAEMGDQDSLAVLLDHLLVAGRVEPELHQSYMALRGIVHLHLDQAPAARLVLRAIQGKDNNPYCLEFEQMCARRSFSGAREFALVNSHIELVDWQHWNTVVADCAVQNDADEWQDLLHHVNRAFPGSPTFDLSNMHRAMDSGHWPSALASATSLHANFPEQRDYGFMKAFCAFHGGDTELALSTLNNLGESVNTTDADVMHLAGEILAVKALESDDEHLGEKATQKLDTSARIYRRNGKAIDNAVSLISCLKRHFIHNGVASQAIDPLRVPRSWMVMLNPAQSANLATSADQELGTLHRPMGKDAMPGDIVLYVTKAAHVAKQSASLSHEWRIVAIYRVMTPPYWHPTNRWQSSLELVDRLDSPIPIDANHVASDKNIRGKAYSLPRGHHARFGVYELDESAMDIVVSAVKRRSEGVSHDSDRRGANDVKKDSV